MVSKKESSGESVQVVVRVRPLSENEIRGGYTSCLACDTESEFPYLTFGFTCISECPVGYKVFASNTDKPLCTEECEDRNCGLCISSQGRCTICESGFYDYDGVCVDECPEGYEVAEYEAYCTMKSDSGILLYL